MTKLPLNPDFKPHFFLALFLSIWLIIFLIFIAPFDLNTLSFKIRLILVPPYGLIFLVSYLVIIPFQNWLYKKNDGWNWLLEIGFVLLFFGVAFVLTYWYYKTPIVNGEYNFFQFLSEVYSPISILILGILIASRWLLTKLVPVKVVSEKLILRGENKSDQLQILPEQVVCLSSAQNYVEVHYRINEKLEKKLLRTTLKKMSAEIPNLIQVHRSHMINPDFFTLWKDGSTILLDSLEIPVSKNYKEQLNQFLKNRP